MKKWFWMLCFLLFSTSILASNFNRIIFFGDSLSDNGNIYNVLFDLVPKSPPYFQGRFSNGPTWAEDLANHFYHEHYVDSRNYAYGGATAVLHLPTVKFMAPTALVNEVDYYLFNHLLENKDNTLFVIWVGGNDYLFADKQIPQLLTDYVVAGIVKEVKKLIQYGGKQFVILNLPDLAVTPFAQVNHLGPQLHELTILHNDKLAKAIATLRQTYPNLQFIYSDIFGRFNELLHNPELYAKKYQVHLTDTHNACWRGNFTQNKMSQDALTKTLYGDLLARNNKQSLDETLQFITQNPLLAEVYSNSKLYEQGINPCDKPDEHVFWDSIHPTAVVHQLLAYLVEEDILQQMK